jgi:hypothetical protein
MWRGDDGRFHTVASPDPGEVFTDAALAAIEQVLAQAKSEDIAELVERRELAVVEHWDDRPVDGEAEAPFVDSTPPIGLFDRVVGSLSELEAALAEVDPRWGLDVVTAFDDLVEADWARTPPCP